MGWCDLVGGSVPLGFQGPQTRPNASCFLLPLAPDVEFSSPSPASHLPVCCHASVSRSQEDTATEHPLTMQEKRSFTRDECTDTFAPDFLGYKTVQK